MAIYIYVFFFLEKRRKRKRKKKGGKLDEVVVVWCMQRGRGK